MAFRMDFASLPCVWALTGAAVRATRHTEASIENKTPFVFMYFSLPSSIHLFRFNRITGPAVMARCP